MARKSETLSRRVCKSSLRHLLRNAAQFNLIKVARRESGNTRSFERSFVRSPGPDTTTTTTTTDRYRGIFCGAAARFRARGEMHDMREEVRWRSFLSRARFVLSRTTFPAAPPRPPRHRHRRRRRRRTYSPTRPLRDRIYLQNVSGAHLVPHRTASQRMYICMRRIIALGIFRRSQGQLKLPNDFRSAQPARHCAFVCMCVGQDFFKRIVKTSFSFLSISEKYNCN